MDEVSDLVFAAVKGAACAVVIVGARGEHGSSAFYGSGQNEKGICDLIIREAFNRAEFVRSTDGREMEISASVLGLRVGSAAWGDALQSGWPQNANVEIRSDPDTGAVEPLSAQRTPPAGPKDVALMEASLREAEQRLKGSAEPCHAAFLLRFKGTFPRAAVGCGPPKEEKGRVTQGKLLLLDLAHLPNEEKPSGGNPKQDKALLAQKLEFQKALAALGDALHAVRNGKAFPVSAHPVLELLTDVVGGNGAEARGALLVQIFGGAEAGGTTWMEETNKALQVAARAQEMERSVAVARGVLSAFERGK